MACCNDIHSGLLRHQITIERNTTTPDGAGGYTDSWAADPVGGVWAYWQAEVKEYMFSSEGIAHGRVESHPRIRATINFRGDVNGAPYYTSADRVVFRGRYYNITAVVDIDGAQEWLSLSLIEGEPS